MKPVDYDVIAPAYDRRYQTNRFEGVREILVSFLGAGSPRVVIELGCGTGQWLDLVETNESLVVGLDLSEAMLANARENAPQALLVRGRAEQLPFRAHTADRLFCINALHHFANPTVVVEEARRTLRPGGGFLTVGLDPHTRLDQWWIYDYFPDAIAADQKRYSPTATIGRLLRESGFVAVSTNVAQHIPAALPYDAALEQGFLDRRSTSQFQVIDDAHWEAGLARLQTERPILQADLRLYATIGWLPHAATT